MGMRSTTQAFQFNVPFALLFQLASPAAQSVPKATVTLADPNRQVVTFDTPDGHDVLGREHRRGLHPL